MLFAEMVQSSRGCPHFIGHGITTGIQPTVVSVQTVFQTITSAEKQFCVARDHMALLVMFQYERFFTEVTIIWPLSSVNPLVSLEICLFTKAFETKWALKRFKWTPRSGHLNHIPTNLCI